MQNHSIDYSLVVATVDSRDSQVVLVVKNLSANTGEARPEFDPWVGKMPWSRKRQPTPVFLPGKLHRPKSLGSYSPQGCEKKGAHAHTNTHV